MAEGIEYFEIKLKLDQVKNQLIIYQDNLVYPVIIDARKIDAFTLKDHFFKKISHPEMGYTYFDFLVEDSLSLLAYRKSEIQEEIENQKLRQWYLDKTSFYLYQNGHFSEIRNKRTLLKSLSKHKKEIKGHLKSENIKVRKEQERAFIEAVNYYNHLEE